jgi:hypothetical protein
MNVRRPLNIRFFTVLLYCTLLCNLRVWARDDVSIQLANHTEAERGTEQQLRRILTRYDLSDWTFTRSVMIDEGEIPHSHPVLTLHTRHGRNDDLLLSTYVHEQLHWFVEQHPKQAGAAIRDLRRIFPRIPTGFPQGSSDEAGNYEHLIVVYLEYRAGQALMGAAKSREVMAFWAKDHYTWIYRQILDHPETVGKVLKNHGLIPGRLDGGA